MLEATEMDFCKRTADKSMKDKVRRQRSNIQNEIIDDTSQTINMIWTRIEYTRE